MRIAPLIVIAALLTACEPAADAPQDAPQTPAETPMPVEPDGGIGDGAQPLDELLAAENTIPARFQGVWDYVDGTCDLASDMRMEVRADTVQYYESMGTVRAVKPDGDGLLVTLAMEGEGQAWEQTTRFELADDGRTLIAAPQDVDAMPRKRCAS